MKYLHYLLVAAAINAALLPVLVLLMDWHSALAFVVFVTPLALRRGAITRRLPMLDGGPTIADMFWSVRPEVYVRKPGFDDFTGV